MRFLGCRFWSLVGAIAFSIGFALPAGATVSISTSNKVIIYPGPGDSIDQLKQQGIEKVDSYGSYWVAEVGDKDLAKLKETFGNRVAPANAFNHVELRTAFINTTGNEPVVPAGLKQVEGPGPRLRIVQFKGPIQPEWLAKLKSLNGAKVINYVPNNAYLVRLDQPAEDKLRAIQGANGPIQWIGSYHPYYKIQRGLLSTDSQDGESLVNVRVTVVGGPDAGQTINAIGKFGLVQSSYDLGNQKVVAMTISVSDIARIAKLSDVIWIEKVERKVLLDEVQALIVTSQTNGPGNGPSATVGITNYLDFLINTVGGGLPAFTNQFEYPVVDVADTGFDATLEEYPGTALQPSFNEFGMPLGVSRLAYQEPLGGYFSGATVDAGCAPLNNNFFGSEDFYDHGTRVASVISGYDTQTNELNELSIYSTIVTQDFTVFFNCSGTGPVTNHFVIPTSPCALVTDIIFSCTSVGTFGTILPLPTQLIVTQVVDSIHQDPSGFQLGLGISPFGRVGSSRIWRQSADIIGTPPHVRFLPAPQPILNCMNGFYPVLFFSAYTEGGRIQNNSWSEDIADDGSNGGRYTVDSQTYDIGVRDALLVGASNNVPGPSPLNQEFIVVFAGNSLLGDAGVAGNNGGFGDLRITAPATAKNVITVIASESVRLDGSGCAGSADENNSFDMWQDSAFGPTVDGRFKPEIVAPGTTIYAAKTLLAAAIDPVLGIVPEIAEDPNGNLGNNQNLSGTFTNLYCAPPQFFDALFPVVSQAIVAPGNSGNEYDCSSGSSYAAPAVSGAIQLLWWYFQHRLTDELGTQLLQPSPAMAKAYLCNSARYLSITNPATGATDTLPSIAQGMGELDLQRMFDQVPRVIRDESTPRAIDVALITTNPAAQQTYFSQSGQSYEASGQIFDPTKPFRVSLAWTDAAGAPGASKELVNDLNLEVTIGGQIYKGNVFSGPNSIPNAGAADNVNNMESVFLPAGQTGTWSVIIRALNIAGDGVPNVGSGIGQDFALVVYNAASTNRSDVPNLSTNNSCQTALALTQFPTSFSNTLSQAVYFGKTLPNPSAGRGGVEEFFKLAQPTPGTTFTINTQGSTFNTVLSVWTVQVLPQTVFVRGECGALTELVSTNGGFGSQVTFTADGSNDYYIVAEPLNNGPGGNFVLNVNATNPGISITPSSLSFAAQTILTASNPQTVTYQNNTIVPVQITNLAITGTNAADFSLASQTCDGSVLAPGVNCTAAVVFNPQTGPLGLRQANLVFTYDAIGSPSIVPLSGTAMPAAPELCLSSSSSTFSFGSQLLTTTSAVQSITITNCGSAALNITNVSVVGFGSNDFSVTQTCTGGPITPGNSCTLNMTFNPQVAGTRLATVVIADDVAGSPTTLSLSGVGVALSPSVCFGSSTVDFESLLQGATGSVQTVIITNCGTASLVISNVSVTGANTGDFIIVSSTCVAVATGATCAVTLEFAPTAGGLRSANLAFVDNIPGSPQLLPLIGNGALSQPDAAIGKTDKLKKMVGAGIINTTGAGQEVVQNVHRGAKKGLRFFVALRNVGSAPDSFTVQGDGNATGFTVNYFLGAIPNDSVDVTSDVESGVFSSDTLAAGAVTSDSTMLRIEVFADKTLVAKGVTKTFNLTFTSVSDPTKVDVVKATVVAK